MSTFFLNKGFSLNTKLIYAIPGKDDAFKRNVWKDTESLQK